MFKHFSEWLVQRIVAGDVEARLQLIETFFGFDPEAYNAVFEDELQKVIDRVTDPAHRRVLESLVGFRWMIYISAAVRNAGYRDQRQVDEIAHDIAVKLLTGKLFTGFDERSSGPMDLRAKRSIGNAVRNVVSKDASRRRNLPSISIGQKFEPGAVAAEELPGRAASSDESVEEFRRLVAQELGDLGLAVLDARLDGEEVKALVGRDDLGNPSSYRIKATVRDLKRLLHQHVRKSGDSAMLSQIEKSLERENATNLKRHRATARRVGANS